MTTRVHSKQHTVTTTTLAIDRPQNYDILEARYRLVRYVIPDQLRYRKIPTDFGRVYNTIRDQIDHPYKSFQHDELDGERNKKWVVYILYPREAPVKDLKLPWFQDTSLPRRDIHFSDLPLHVLLKLLQIRFFRTDETSRFVGQDKCYVYARPGGVDFFYCVEVELKGAPTNTEGAPMQEFRVVPHARRFGKVETPYQPSRPLFGKRAVGNKFFFIHLKSGVAEQEPAVYDIVTFPGRRAQIKYHDPRDPDAGKVKIVLDFIQQFLADLRELGISGKAKERTFTRASPPRHVDLPVQQLGVIGVYDNRLKRAHLLADYVDLFNSMSPGVRFVALDDIRNAPEGGVLVLLDAKAEDFDEGGMLSGESDPYPALYAAHPDVPKQSLNVNTNDPDALEGGDYLDYPLLQSEDGDLARNLRVALSELYLKCAVIHGIGRFALPLLPKELAFIRRAHFDGEAFTTALWFEGDRLRFLDWRDPAQREAFYQLLDGWGVCWDEQYELLLAERRRTDRNGALKDLPTFDIVVGRDLFVAIEDLEERALYDYQEIGERHKEQWLPHPIAYFRLASQYDRVRQKQSAPLSLDELSRRGLLSGGREPTTDSERSSLAFYGRLLEYDALLEEIAVTHPTLSYLELTSGEWLERIARIFDSKPTKEGKHDRKNIARIYKDLGMFLSEKGQDVQLYQGIWYDNTNAFLVGSRTGMNVQGQERAHLIRRFQVMQGEAHFDEAHFLSTMGVLFVRSRQYTVSPYYFHLIDLYVENVLRYTPSGTEDFNGSSASLIARYPSR
jgi:hypothetical protein